MESLVPHSDNDNVASTQRELVASFDHVSKKFCRHLRRSMAYGLLDLSRNLVGLKMKQTDTLRRGEFWALNDVSFELRRGDFLGVMGVNGSGKSTLLRVLAGIMPPDKGEVMLKGYVCPLIAIGAGFHPHMTGRENIFVNGSILGMSREDIETHFESIVEFAEIDKFLDAPVSTYSSGMKVRLGFAIATAIVPDILLLDEVFAVGDVVFRQRSIERIQQISDRSAVMLVSNRPEFVEMLCNRALWLDKGKIVAQGAVDDVATEYAEETSHRSAVFALRQASSRGGNGDIRFDDAPQVYGENSGPNEIAIRKEALVVEAPFTCHTPWSEVYFGIEVIDLVRGFPVTIADCTVPEITAEGTLRCIFYNLPLAPRSYAVSLRIMHKDVALDIWRGAALLTARRIGPKPSTIVGKVPHELTVEMGEIIHEFRYKRPKKDEATIRTT